MSIFCSLLGHTWVHKTNNPKISWNTSKAMNELDITVEEGQEPKFWLQCQRCGEKNETPTREQVSKAV